MKPRYLTKSRFKLAVECPTKLFYTGKNEYANQNIEDQFLLALADGGFQVGELAKHYFPGGHEIESLDYEEALRQTNELLQQDCVVIYEAAIRYENLFIRVDILVKEHNSIQLIEVKAKSFDSNNDSFFLKNGSIGSGWRSYLYDVAFQKHVACLAFPHCFVSAYLMMTDKSALCPTDGLNQKFKITKDKAGRSHVTLAKELTVEDLSERILVQVKVDDCCRTIYAGEETIGDKSFTFAEYVEYLADCYARDEKIPSAAAAGCGGCEFIATEEEMTLGLLSGFHVCWKESLGWTDQDFLAPTVLDIWNFRKKDKYIQDGVIKLSDFEESDISPKSDHKPGISASERQWLQIEKAQNNDNTPWVDVANLRSEMSSWVYPLHFIDFETSMVAIPFNKGRHPYEGIAFQFSHHVVYKDGNIKHIGEYLNAEPGVFPNYEFVRKLKAQLEKDRGSVFRYAAHENTYLNMIYKQLMEETEYINDREELCSFIRDITKSGSSSDEVWEGKRNMIDMLELVKRYYYDPAMKGSNSIKKVLPAILNSSTFLKDKYSKNIYGAKYGIPSLNFKDWKWIEFDENGQVIDPYKLLPKMFLDITDKENEILSNDDVIKDGGAALTAYAKMQFEEMSEYERKELTASLLKYCELDTFAMVMIYEGWKDMVGI